MRRAFTALRSGSPGPVVLEMHQDVLTAEADDAALAYTPVGTPGKAGPSDADVQRAADLLVNANLPILNAGGGAMAAGAAEEVMELAEMLSMPVATTIMGKGIFPENHPLSLGGGVYPRSRYASGAALQINRKADVVLAVGNSFRQPNGTDGRPIPEGVSIIHVNADAADLNKTYQVDLPVLADAKLALRAIIDAVRQRLGPNGGGIKQEIVDEIRACHEKHEMEWMPRFNDPETPTNGYRVVHELQQLIDPDRTIALHDAGGSRGYVVPFWQTTRPRNFVAMGGMAAMGWVRGRRHRHQAGPPRPPRLPRPRRRLLRHDRHGAGNRRPHGPAHPDGGHQQRRHRRRHDGHGRPQRHAPGDGRPRRQLQHRRRRPRLPRRARGAPGGHPPRLPARHPRHRARPIRPRRSHDPPPAHAGVARRLVALMPC